MLIQMFTDQQWALLFSGLTSLAYFVGFVILGALSFLLGYAVIPSVLLPPYNFVEMRYQRVGLYLIGFVSFAAAAYQIARCLGLVFTVLGQVFPRWWI